MEQTGREELFEVRLTVAGKYYIRKFASIVRVSVFLGFLVSLIFLSISIIVAIKTDPTAFSNDKALAFNITIRPYYAFIYTVLIGMQLYNYWKIGKLMSMGLDGNDEKSFNQSFESLYRAIVFATLGLFVSLAMGILDLNWTIKHFL